MFGLRKLFGRTSEAVPCGLGLGLRRGIRKGLAGGGLGRGGGVHVR
jgi:hypothetical protein